MLLTLSGNFALAPVKRVLYRIKCLIEDIYHDLPKFAGEEEWEQERLVELLSR